MEHKASLHIKIIGLTGEDFYVSNLYNQIKGGVKMKYTHYYKELGLEPTSFPFEGYEDICDRNIPNDEGFTGIEFFSLDFSLAIYIYGRLRYFQDNCLYGHPNDMTEKQWKDVLNKMVKAFKLYCIHEDSDMTIPEQERKARSKNKQKQINYGMRLFIKYFSHLWY